MNKLINILLITCIFGLTNCTGSIRSLVKPDLTASAIEKRNLMIGKWLGEMKDEKGNLQKWLTTRFPDGTYKIQFRTPNEENNYKEQVEVGLWGISGPIYFTIMKGWITESQFVPSDPKNPTYYDAYEIIEISQNKFKYHSYDADITFNVKKVNDDYELPKTNP